MPDPDVSEKAERIEPETETERRLYEIAAQILGTDTFGVTDNLVSFGLNSIIAMRFAALIGQTFGAHVSVSAILRTPVIRTLADEISSNDSDAKERLHSYPKRELYPVTENQRGVIIDWERNRNTTQYNIPDVMLFEGVSGETLVQAVKAAVDAHRYLKTGFVYADGDMMQRRRDEDAAQVSLTQLDRAPDQAFFQSRIRPFDLLGDRLYRLEVYTHGDKAWLFADIHHTIYDGLSGKVFTEDIRRALAGEKLRGETLTAYDVALYEQELRESGDWTEARQYFDALLESAETASLPASSTPDQTPAGVFALRIPGEAINAFCRRCGVTRGSFFQAAFSECLRRMTLGRKPFYVTANNGRSASPKLMDCVGMFVKTLAVAAPDAGDMTSEDYARAMHRQLQESYARDFYPYTELVDRHGLRAEMMLIYQGSVADESEPDSMALALDQTKFPLSLEIAPEGDGYTLAVEYDGMRYSRADVERFAGMVKNASLGLATEKYPERLLYRGLCRCAESVYRL